MKLHISYMVTSEVYFRHFEGFLTSLHYFMPKTEKYLNVLSDQKESFDKVAEKHKDYCKENDIHLIYHFIEHKPWPMNALLKFKYTRDIIKPLLDNPENNEDVIFYIDSKVEFRDVVTFEELIGEAPRTSFISVPHNMHPNYPTLYEKLVFYHLNEGTHAQISVDYFYHQSGFFGGNIHTVYPMCVECHKWTKIDLANHKIPAVDDESYLNRWVYEHQDTTITLDPSIYWGDEDEPECPYNNAKINIRDHSDAEEIKYLTRKGLINV